MYAVLRGGRCCSTLPRLTSHRYLLLFQAHSHRDQWACITCTAVEGALETDALKMPLLPLVFIPCDLQSLAVRQLNLTGEK